MNLHTENFVSTLRRMILMNFLIEFSRSIYADCFQNFLGIKERTDSIHCLVIIMVEYDIK